MTDAIDPNYGSKLSILTRAYGLIVDVALDSCLSDAEVENLRDSASRIAKGVLEMVWSEQQIREAVVAAMDTIFPLAEPPQANGQPIIVGPVDTHSLCPHHLLPIVNTVIIGYVNEGRVLGLSKIPRVVDALAHRAVVQEQYTLDMLNLLTKGKLGHASVCTPLTNSVAVNVRAVHHCMICRGVKGRAVTETEELSGVFAEPGSRQYQMFSRFLSEADRA